MKSVKILLFFAFIGISFAVKENIIDDYFQPDGKHVPSKTLEEMGQSSGSKDQYVTSLPNPEDQVYELNHKEDCKCRLRATGKIVGGMIAQPHTIPWMVSLADENNDHFCGGLVINRDHILTSVICLGVTDSSNIRVRIGLDRLDDQDIDTKTYNVLKVFRTRDSKGGIAILKLAQPIDKFEVGKVEPACLDTYSALKEFPLGLMASGWGSTRVVEHSKNSEWNIDPMSTVLKMAFFKEDEDKQSNLIHIKSDKGDSVCGGDMGGPLHYTERAETTVVGVGDHIKSKRYPNGFIRMCFGEAYFARLASLSNKLLLEKVVGTNYCKPIHYASRPSTSVVLN